MRARLRALWEARAPRERKVIAVLAAVLLVIAYGLLLQLAGQARAPLRASVATLRAQAVALDQQALEYAQLRAAPAATASSGDLLQLVQGRVEAAGLAHGLARMDAPDADHVVVVFGAIAFADWLDWVAGLQEQQVRLDSCRIEALATPGLVSISATLARPPPR